MTSAPTYQFDPLKVSDLPLVTGWQALPHVLKWWDTVLIEDDINDPRINTWLVSLEGVPFAFIQDYDPHRFGGHYFGSLPKGTRGVDQFIGKPEMIGQGHGPAFIRQHVQRLFDEGAPCLGTDPHPDNASAIRAYEKVGFEMTGEPLDSQWGLVQPMVCTSVNAG